MGTGCSVRTHEAYGIRYVKGVCDFGANAGGADPSDKGQTSGSCRRVGKPVGRRVECGTREQKTAAHAA